MPIGKIVQTRVDGVEVEGRIQKSGGNLDVIITKPFHWLSKGSHITALARGRSSLAGKYGDARAKGILRDLYQLGCFLRDNMEMLQGEWHRGHERMKKRAHELRIPDSYDDKAALRKRLKSGEIDNETYERLFAALQKKKEDFFQEFRMVDENLFEKQFPMVVPHGTRDRVLEILHEPNLLFYGTSTPRRKI